MKKRLKRLVAFVSALAIVIASICYTPMEVKADVSFTTSGGITYNLTAPQGDVTGLVIQAAYDNIRFGIAWAAEVGTCDVTIKDSEGTSIRTYNNQGTGMSLWANGTDTPSIAGLGEGTYTVEWQATGDKLSTATLTVSEEGGETSPVTESSKASEATEVTETSVQWSTNEALTAALGEGTVYRTEGTMGIGDWAFHADSVQVNVGADGQSITVKFNDTTLVNNTQNTAAGGNSAAAYSNFVCGENVYWVHEVFNNQEYDFKIYIKTPLKAKNFSIYDYSAYTGKYIFKFDEPAEGLNYKVYIDENDTGLTIKGSGDYITTTQVNGLNLEDGTHSVAIEPITEEAKAISNDNCSITTPITSNTLPANAGDYNDISQIYIHTDDSSILPKDADINKILSKAAGKKPAAITIVDQSGTYDDIIEDTDKTTVKVRGNSTAGAEKRAYNISFNSKINPFGLADYEDGESTVHGAEKKWSLLANAFDKTLIRNKLGIDLGYDAGLLTNSKSRFVDLYFNGLYMGNYQIIESIEAKPSRVNIDSENGKAGKYNTDALIELENIHAIETGVLNFKTNILSTDPTKGSQWIFGSPETAEDIDKVDAKGDPILTPDGHLYSEQKIIDTKALFEQLETELAGNNDMEVIKDIIDVDSFVNYYLMNELFVTKDINQSSTRFYVKGGKIYAGPMWDLDLSSGNVDVPNENWGANRWVAKEMPWLAKLMENETFYSKVVAKYEEMHTQIEELYADGGTIDDLVDEMSGSIARNYLSEENGGAGWEFKGRQTGDGWSNSDKWDSYAESQEAFKDFLEARVAFLDEEWNINDELKRKIVSSVTNLAKNKKVEMTHFQEGTLNAINDGKVDFSTDVSVSDPSATVTTGHTQVRNIDSGSNDVYVTVDLGEYYDASSIDSIFIQYKNIDADDTVLNKSYKVQYSSDGVVFKDVVAEKTVSAFYSDENISANVSKYTIDDVSSQTGAVRFVKIYYPTQATYGIDFSEVAVLADDAQKMEYDKTPTPTITAVGGDRSVTGTITPGEGSEDGTEYYIYVDGKYAGKTTSSTTFSVDVSALGNHKIVAKAVYEGYLSEASNEVEVTVTGNLLPSEMINNPGGSLYNLALNRSNDQIIAIDRLAEGSKANLTQGSLTDTGNFVPYPEGAGWDGEGKSSAVIIDLGKTYNASSVDSILVQYNEYGATNMVGKTYGISYSENGEDFTAIFTDKTISELTDRYTLDSLSGLTGGMRYVKVTFNNIPTYGPQLTEIAVFDTDLDATETPTSQATSESESESESDIEPDFKWIKVPNSDDLYYNDNHTMTQVVNVQQPGWATEMGVYITATNAIQSVSINGVELESNQYAKDGAGAVIYLTSLAADVNEVVVNGTQTITFKHMIDYAPTGLAATITNDIASVVWTANANATAAGATYAVLVGNKSAGYHNADVTSNSASLDLSSLGYGLYDVKLKTYVNGEEVDEQIIQLRYSDLDVVSFSGTGNQPLAWEYDRTDKLEWKVNGSNITGYAIYVDGDYYTTTTDSKYNVPAAVIAEMSGEKDSFDQLTSHGSHSIAVVALIGGETAPALLENANQGRIVGTDEYKINLNYIYGDSKYSWNDTKDDSVWNFTITDGSSMKVDYMENGSVKLSNLSTKSAWQLKAAIYDTLLNVDEGEVANVSFDIKGPADLIGTEIGIKTVSEEVYKKPDGTYDYWSVKPGSAQDDGKCDLVYQDIDDEGGIYKFVDDGNGGAVLHYSLSFEPRRDTYDLLFDLHGVVGHTITLDNAESKNIYSVTKAIASPNVLDPSVNNSGTIAVSWDTNVPSNEADHYFYKVYIGPQNGNYTCVSENATPGAVYNGYTLGSTYKVKVESYFNDEGVISKTNEATTEVTIPLTQKPNLIISDISIEGSQRGVDYVGETVPITVTMKNIGSADTTVTDQTLIYSLYVGRIVDGEFEPFDTGSELKRDGIMTVLGHTNEDNTISFTINYNITEAGNIAFKAVADENNVEDEASESDNTSIIRYRFYEKPSAAEGSDILGFQINYSKADGAASEFAPSFRTLARVSKVIDGEEITQYGFVYSGKGRDYVNKDNMVIDSEDSNISHIEANVKLNYNEWNTGDVVYTKENSNFYALTIKNMRYDSRDFTREYSFRTYYVKAGEVVYSDKIYTVTMEEIARSLYRNQKMQSVSAHNFLYDSILNIVAIRKNYKNIGVGMLSALAKAKLISSTSDDGYKWVNTYYKDLYEYATLELDYEYKPSDTSTAGYTQSDPFKSIMLGDETDTSTNAYQLLQLLNQSTGDECTTIFGWIEKNLSQYLEERYPYSWEKDIYIDFETELDPDE